MAKQWAVWICTIPLGLWSRALLIWEDGSSWCKALLGVKGISAVYYYYSLARYYIAFPMLIWNSVMTWLTCWFLRGFQGETFQFLVLNGDFDVPEWVCLVYICTSTLIPYTVWGMAGAERKKLSAANCIAFLPHITIWIQRLLGLL